MKNKLLILITLFLFLTACGNSSHMDTAITPATTLPSSAPADRLIPDASQPSDSYFADTEATIMETTVPDTLVQKTSIPETTIPETSVPETSVPETTVPETESPTAAPVRQHDYVLNKNTKKFHYPTCTSVKDIKPSNRQDYTGTHDEVVNMGYVPCKKCNP